MRCGLREIFINYAGLCGKIKFHRENAEMLPKRSHFCQISLLNTLPTQLNPKTFFLFENFFGYLTFQASNFSFEIKNCAKKFKELLTLAENISKKIFWKFFLSNTFKFAQNASKIVCLKNASVMRIFCGILGFRILG